VTFNTVGGPDDLVLFVKPVGRPVILDGSTVVISSVEIVGFVEVVDFKEVLLFLIVVI